MTLAEQAEQAATELRKHEVIDFDGDFAVVASILDQCAAALREREGAQQAGQVPEEAKSLTAAYAEGRGDQYEEDCRVVRLLFENLDDVDELGDGRINTTRVRELLSHFAAAPEAPAQPEQGEREAFGAAELDDLAELHKRTTQGRWGQGATSHNTVAKRDGQPDYRIADFHHADDASFVDAAHQFMPQLIALARAAIAAMEQREPVCIGHFVSDGDVGSVHLFPFQGQPLAHGQKVYAYTSPPTSADARDAERYRWLCSHAIVPSPSLWDFGVAFAVKEIKQRKGQMHKVELDAAIDTAIDAAIAATKEQP